MNTAVGFVQFDPKLGDVAIRCKTEPTCYLFDLRLMTEPWLERIPGALHRRIIEAHFSQRAPRFAPAYLLLAIVNGPCIHWHRQHMADQRIQFTQRMAGERSRYGQRKPAAA